ncbi:hypothetical protein IHQ68_15665 [Chelatococcus sambhunathii]|uniref:Histidine kinase n=2 Tax=Chelatococcus sambhunathii TaxID=363953 RepID=A0ABU1DIV7_9HYPH|nr:hypothetical protein [Chelatococcus sambhunathii]
MADYYPVISRAVAGLDPNTGEARRKVYERARSAIVRQLRAIEPPVSEEDIARERMQLEEAIRRVESEAPGAAETAAPKSAAPKPAEPKPAPDAPRSAAAAAGPQRPPASPGDRPAGAPAGDAKSAQAKPAQAKPAQAKPAATKGGPVKADQARPATRADGRPIVQPAGARPASKKPGRSAPLIALGALAAIAVAAGLFAARGQIASLFSGGSSQETAQTTTESKPEEASKTTDAGAPETKTDDRLPQQDQAAESKPAEPAAPPAEAPADEQKEARAPEATAPAPAPEPAPQPAPQESRPASGPLVAQRAVLYEEGPNQQSGEALSGSVVWRTESVNGGANQPLDTALKGEIDIPGRNLRAILTLRRNVDATLPASHTIEVQFILPPDFPNAGVSNVPGVLMKTDESARGAAVSGLSVKVTNGFFLIGLSNIESEKTVNEQLLRDRSWIDVPILYDNGRRAVLTLEKGTPGKQAFDQAFDAWKSASATSNPPR